MTRDEALTMAREVTGLTLVSNGRKMTDAQIVVMCQAAYERGAADRIDADAERIKALEEQLASQKNEWLAWNEKRKALEADAERYRWLRDVHAQHYTVTRYVGGATIPRFEGAQLDAAIDAARSKT